MDIKAKKVMSLHVQLGEDRVVGQTTEGKLVIIPIVGGTFEGEGIRGKICLGGADWNTLVSDQLCHVCARYWLETDDGAIISVVNEGWMDITDPHALMKTTPHFECDHQGPYAHLCRGNYVGELTGGGEHCVNITFWKVQ